VQFGIYDVRRQAPISQAVGGTSSVCISGLPHRTLFIVTNTRIVYSVRMREQLQLNRTHMFVFT